MPQMDRRSKDEVASDKVSLRFRDARTEDFFVKSHHDRLVTNTGIAMAIPVVINSGRFALHLMDDPYRGTPEARSTRLLISTTSAGLIATGTLFVAAALFNPLRRRLCYRAMEVLVAAIIALLPPSMFLMDLYYAPKLLGYNPNDIWKETQYWSDTRCVLTQCMIILTSHLVLPIRWVMLIPLEVSCVVSYAGFGQIVGSPDVGTFWQAFFYFTAMVLISVLGRRTIEIHQRESLTQLIRERTVRAETEFKLSRVEAKAKSDLLAEPKRGSADVRSEVERCSRPDTTVTSLAFLDGNNLSGITHIARAERWFIESEELWTKPEEILGSGGFGRVISGYYSHTSVAVKMTVLDATEDQGEVDEDKREAWTVALLNEIRILRHVRHPNVVQFYGASIDEEAGDVRLVLELVKGPCLQTLILGAGMPGRPLRVPDQFKAITDTCRALCYLHSRKPSIVHGDLKGTNIVMECDPCLPSHFRAKLLDFGLARVLTRNPQPMGGTLMWVAPEVLNDRRKVNSSADFFSFGRLAFFVLTGFFPFGRACRADITRALKDNALPPLPWPRANPALIAECRPWVERCSSLTIEERPDMPKIMVFLSRTAARMGAEFVADIGGLPQPFYAEAGEPLESSSAYEVAAEPRPAAWELVEASSDTGAATSEAGNSNLKLHI